MLNLTKYVLNSDEYDFKTKFMYLISIDVYLAENMKDYVDNISKVKVPAYKELVYSKKVNVLLYNVGIKRFDSSKSLFEVHDSTQSDIMFWPTSEDKKYRCDITFAKAYQVQGVREKDWLTLLTAQYFFDSQLSVITGVYKTPNSYKHKEEAKIKEKLKKLVPSLDPLTKPT